VELSGREKKDMKVYDEQWSSLGWMVVESADSYKQLYTEATARTAQAVGMREEEVKKSSELYSRPPDEVGDHGKKQQSESGSRRRQTRACVTRNILRDVPSVCVGAALHSNEKNRIAE
jgi:hypothetical protein